MLMRGGRRAGWSGVGTLVAGLAVSAALAACGEAGAPGTDAPAEPRRGGTAVIAAETPIHTLAGVLAQETYTAEVNRYLLYLPLIRYGPDLEYRPALAESWEVEGDTAVTFRLRRDVSWHDGEPTTAHDAAFTYALVKDPRTGYANPDHFSRFTGVEVVDSFTVRFTYAPHLDPWAGFPFLTILPRHLLKDIPPDQLGQAPFNSRPVGNGPFRFVSSRTNDRWVFEANPEFPEALGGRPNLDRIVWRVVQDRTARITELQAGETHLAVGAPGDRLDALAERPGLRAIVRPTFTYGLIAWNGKREPFGRADVRRALTMALDRREMLEVLRGGYGDVALTPVHPEHWAFNETLQPLPHDPEAARALLESAGYEDRDGDGIAEDATGAELAFALTIPAESQFNLQQAQIIQAQLRDAGVAMEIRAVDVNTMIGQITSPEREFDAVLLSFVSDFRINLRQLFHTETMNAPYQFASYSNPEVDRLLDELAVQTDRDAARPLWNRLQELLLQEQPWSFLDYTPDLYLARETLRGTHMDVRGMLVDVADWWLVEDG